MIVYKAKARADPEVSRTHRQIGALGASSYFSVVP